MWVELHYRSPVRSNEAVFVDDRIENLIEILSVPEKRLPQDAFLDRADLLKPLELLCDNLQEEVPIFS